MRKAVNGIVRRGEDGKTSPRSWPRADKKKPHDEVRVEEEAPRRKSKAKVKGVTDALPHARSPHVPAVKPSVGVQGRCKLNPGGVELDGKSIA